MIGRDDIVGEAMLLIKSASLFHGNSINTPASFIGGIYLRIPAPSPPTVLHFLAINCLSL